MPVLSPALPQSKTEPTRRQRVALRRQLGLPHRVGEFARADRQFARSVFLGLILVGLVGLIGPLIAYRSDVAAIRSQFRTRISQEALVHAEALSLHFQLLQAELERLALRPEVDLRDNTIEPEKLILDFTHRKSALFGAGVVLVDSEGNQVWSEPKDLLAGEKDLASRRWFQKALARQV